LSTLMLPGFTVNLGSAVSGGWSDMIQMFYTFWPIPAMAVGMALFSRAMKEILPVIIQNFRRAGGQRGRGVQADDDDV